MNPSAVMLENAIRGAAGLAVRPRCFFHFGELPPEYPGFFERAAGSTFFNTLPWFENLARTTFNSSDHPRIYAIEAASDGHPAAALVMHAKQPRNQFAPRTLSALANYYSSLFGPAVDTTRISAYEGVRELVRSICTEKPGWDAVDLHPLDFDSVTFQCLTDAFGSFGFLVQAYFCFHNWYLKVNGRSYAEYSKTLPSFIRNKLKKVTRQFVDTRQVTVDISTGTDELDSRIQAYEKVYRESWKIPEPHPEFIRGLMRMCADQGWLRLAVASFQGEPGAAQFWIVKDGVASIYKLAYDERFSKYSLGTLLSARLMQHVIDVDRVYEVDYLTGDDAYKRHWMSDRRERWGMLALNSSTIRGIASIVRHLGGHKLKTFWRSISRRRGNQEQDSQEL